MSPETSGGGHIAEPLEQKGWQGQKWEYLVVKYDYQNVRQGIVLGRTSPGGLLSSGKELDPAAEKYNSLIKTMDDERIKQRDNTGVSIADVLNLLGNDGWELVAAIRQYSLTGVDYPALFLKRPNSL